MPVPVRQQVRVRLRVADAVDREAETIRGDLREGGLGAPRAVSRKQAMPRPSSAPRAAAATRRAGKPAASEARASTSRFTPKRPPSTFMPIAVTRGASAIMFSARSAAGSTPVSRAAASTRRSTM
jgi:hypothetical protein